MAPTWLNIFLLGKKLNVKSLHLQGDSKVIIEGIMRGTMQAWIYQFPINRIREELDGFINFKINHVHWEGNVEADRLANWATTFPMINSIIVEDYQMVSCN